MTDKDEQKLDGSAFSSAAMMAMLDILNYPDQNPDTISLKERFRINMKGKPGTGKVFIASTVEDMNRGADAKLLWKDSDAYGLTEFKK